MFRKYVLYNETFGNVCLDGRRFFTVKGATKAYMKIPAVFRGMAEYSIRKLT